jgi:excisionase family DNA binding protein
VRYTPAMETPTLLTTTQAAEQLRARGLDADRQRVRRWAGQGRFPGARKVGRDWLIPAEALAEFQPRPSGYRGHTKNIAPGG